jgi:hypothetical protein
VQEVDRRSPERSILLMPDSPVFSTAAVAAPNMLAAETGRNILAEGGNAVEAMIAMAATIAVVYPHMNGIGGDAFWLIREPGGRVRAIEACGPAGSLATIERYRAKGFDAIPGRGPDAAVTVAGLVGGWALAGEFAMHLGGALPLATLLSDAIRFAREGAPVSASEAACIPNEREALLACPGFANAFLVEGKTPDAGVDPDAPGARRNARAPRRRRAQRLLPRRHRPRDRRRPRARGGARDPARPRAVFRKNGRGRCRRGSGTPRSTTFRLRPRALAALLILGISSGSASSAANRSSTSTG